MMLSTRGLHTNLSSVYAELLTSLVKCYKFRNIFYYKPVSAGVECQLEQRLSTAGSNAALLLWHAHKSLQLSEFLNSELLVIACLPAEYRVELLQVLADSLRYIRQSKLLIEMAGGNSSQAAQVLEYCHKRSMLNAVLIFGDFLHTQLVYSYQAFPCFALQCQQLASLPEVFRDKTNNLRGYGLRTMPDQSEPNTILYQDAKGRLQITGYVWQMLLEYARRHNAYLQLIKTPVEGNAIQHMQMLDMTELERLDIAASVQPMSMRSVSLWHQYSYPAYATSWCTMLPVEQPLRISQMQQWTLPAATSACLLLLYVGYKLLPLLLQRLRGMWLPHWYVVGWSAMCLLLACNYQGRLLALFAAPPISAAIDSFAALSHSQLRIFGLRAEYNSYDFELRIRYADMFRLSDNGSNLLRERNALNSSYGYTVTHTKWQLYAVQQSYSSRPVFRYATELCYYQTVLFGLVIPENSAHRQQLHGYLLQLGESGLLKHWVGKSFYYMVQAGRLQIKEFSAPRQVQPLALADLSLTLGCYLGGLLISLAIFACELFIHRAYNWLAYGNA